MDTKALRQKILTLAIRGKLVPQDPKDEPASVLLERIREQKKQMVKEGKLKDKDSKNDTIIFVGEDNLHYEKFQDGTVKCIEEEIPFEVPEGWVWCRLKNICHMTAGKSKPADQIKSEPFDGYYPCYGGNGIRGYVDEYNQEGTFSIVGRQGALCGNINIASGKFYATEHAVVTILFSSIDFNWSNYILEALNLNSYASGAAQPGLSVENVLTILVPVPPCKEQVRIGLKISSAIDVIENITVEKDELETMIHRTKSKVLDLAIQGKLVQQNPDDEPASFILERIRAEKEKLMKSGKIKGDKKESIIYRGADNSYYLSGDNEELELPFEIPASWEWSTLYEVCDYGTNISVNCENIDDDAWILDLEDIEKDTGKVLKKVTNAIRKTTSTKHRFEQHMVLYSKLRPYLNKVVLADEAGYCTSEILPLQFKKYVLAEYALIFLMSPTFVSYANQCSYGMKMPRLGTKDGQRAIMPIPPYEEQKRIVELIANINSSIDFMTAQLV